ncbi:MAG: alpha/beta hydrolase [Hespellia sp.]|nr:alpha/beta hydrolase [Hespellia sp.]
MQLRCGDATIYYEEYGTAGQQTMILLHGNSDDHTYFRNQIAYFRRGFHVFVLDTRSHGQSTHGRQPLSFDLLAEDLHIFVAKKNLTDMILLGFSDGGNIALTYALRYPAGIRCMILNGANLHPEGMRQVVHKLTVHLYQILKRFAPYCSYVERKHQVIGLMANHPHISTEELHTLKMPILVIAGEYDLIRENHTRHMAHALPRGRLVIMKRADHFCARKQPQRFNRIVHRFIMKNK